jgi:GTP-binding protein
MTLATFVKSAVEPKDYPDETRPEVALVGRSNAGKSTLLNAMCGGKKVAKVSGTPGKTRLVNFFDVGEKYRLVDLPGYGYAARDKIERNQWAVMVENFFKERANLIGFILVCDIRRSWTSDEQTILDMAIERGLECLCVLTKLDKLSRGDSVKLHKSWIKTSGQNEAFFKPVSALNNDGVRELEESIFKAWIKPRNQEALKKGL